MSLLIDALKQAEASRLQAEQPNNSGGQTDRLSLEPLGTTQTSDAQATSSSENSRVITPAAPRTSGTRTPSLSEARENARELFAVKQKKPSRAPLIITVVGLLILATGACYLWWATQPRGLQPGPGLINNAYQPIADNNTTGSSEPISISKPIAALSKSNTDQQIASAGSTPTLRVMPNSAKQTLRSRTIASPAQSPEDDVTKPVVRHGAETVSNASQNSIQLAYHAWQAGDINQARDRYREVLQQEPHNVDALDALGMIALRSGQADSAGQYFRDALVVDPKDATAVSQLSLLYADSDPVTAESRLRSLLSGQPNSSVAHFALGSLLTKQGRWSEAQQSFFQAYTLDGNNPDVLYNLAVSLDHLRQTKPAQQYYERALQAAKQRPASFDLAAARARALTLASMANLPAANR